MRQELVDVSITLQLIDKNNFHVVYSASSFANTPGTARPPAKGLPILQFYACTQQEETCSSLTLPYTHIRVQPRADSHIHACPDTFTLMTQTPAYVFMYRSPQAASIRASAKCSGIRRCTYIVMYRNTLSQVQLRQHKGMCVFEDAFT